jgi:light-harvesting protein B-800-850 alpha chain
MNQGRIWCVVSPTVGLPLFLTGVAATSFIVHACVLSHTTWFGNYWQGKAARTAELNGSAASVASLTSQAQPGFVVSVNPVAATSGNGASFVVTVAPSQVATAQSTQPAHGTAKLALAAK